MNVNFTKLISSAAAVLAVGSSAFAQSKTCPPTPSCCTPSPVQPEPGYELCGDKFPAAYNAAARFDVQCSWDVFATASFLYWYANQDAMGLAYPYPADSSDYSPTGGTAVIQEFSYNPGFKVGLGADFDHDNWVGFVEYTWFHQQTKTENINAGAGNMFSMSDWFYNLYDVTSFSSKWRSNLDILDATLSRPFYQGRSLTVLPFGGLRGAWIRQNLRMDASSVLLGDVQSHNKSNSWAVGPRAGMQAHWLIGSGFRIEGDAAGSLLYTRFTNVGHRQDSGTGGDIDTLYMPDDLNTVNPTFDMGLGLGWGSYFDRQSYHFDLLANYDFNVFFGQNVMRTLVNTDNAYAEAATGSLYLQGLTVTARFDF